MLRLAALLAIGAFAPPPVNARFDYQIGEAYPPPAGVRVVSRDWSSRPPARRGYADLLRQRLPDPAGGRRGRPTLVLRELGRTPGGAASTSSTSARAAKRRRGGRAACSR